MNQVNLERARYNMVEQQVRPWDVLDQRVLDLMLELPRELFVPESYRNLAYADIEIPLGHGETMLPPKLEGRILQNLDLRATDSVLEIGTGGGYLTALLSRLTQHVTSVDIVEEFIQQAQRRLSQAGVTNASLEYGDAAHGWRAGAPYDVIAVTGSVPLLPDAYLQQLAPQGRLFVVVGEAPVMQARLVTRIGEREWHHEALFETQLPPLRGAPRKPRFVL